MPAEGDNNAKRADNNREKRIAAHRALDALLEQLAAPEFTGSVTLEINGVNGLYGRIRKATTCYEN